MKLLVKNEKNFDKHKQKMKKVVQNLAVFLTVLILFISVLSIFYLKFLPFCVQNNYVINFIEKYVKNAINVDLTIEKPYLKTEISSKINLGFKLISLKKAKKPVLTVKNANISLSFSQIFKKQIEILDYSTDEIFLDVNELIKILPKTTQKQKPSEIKLEWLNSRFYLGKILVLYSPIKDLNVRFTGKNLEITAGKNPKYIHFNSNLLISKGNYKFNIALQDKNKVYNSL